MKKIFLLFAAVCAFAACDPTHEDISNSGNITVDDLKAMTTVTVDKASDGQNGNVITCKTSAPVNAKWTIGGKDFIGNYAWKKMKVGQHIVTITALCADGTELKADFPVECQVITDPLQRFYIYGEPGSGQEPLVLGPGDAAAGRFSANEGKGLPFLSDDVYWGFKTLIFEILETKDGPFIWGDPDVIIPTALRVMNGWWSATYADGVEIHEGLWELPLTEEIAKDCAQGNGGGGKDLDLLVTSGSITVGSVYYEE